MKPHTAAPREEGWFTRERILTLALIVGTSLTLTLCFLLVIPFVPALTWAVTFAVIAQPVHRWLSQRIPSPGLGAFLAVLFVVALILIPLGILTATAASQAAAGLYFLNDQSSKSFREQLLRDYPQAEPAVLWIEQNIDLRSQSDVVIKQVGGDLLSVASGSLAALTQMLIALFLLFYFFRDRQELLQSFRALLPLTERETDVAVRRVKDTIHATVFGSLMVAIVQGILAGIMFWILGLPAPVLWGTVTALVAVIPYLGSFVVWVPAAAILAIQGAWIKAAILVGWGVLAVGLIDNILYPVLVGTRLRLHTLTAFIAFIGGLALFGISGIILGPVAVALALALFDIWKLRMWKSDSAEQALKKDLKEEEGENARKPTARAAPGAAGS